MKVDMTILSGMFVLLACGGFFIWGNAIYKMTHNYKKAILLGGPISTILAVFVCAVYYFIAPLLFELFLG